MEEGKQPVNQPEVSVIMAVYNTERYLRESILSVVGQTFDNWELIVIDDGSTDQSKDICDDMGRQDQRIVVVHKPNSGQADSRNVAIGMARGEYVFFVDSDDWIAPNTLEYLLDCQAQSRADAVVCSYYKHSYICYLRTSCTHGRECLVTRCIEEYDLLAVDLDLGSTDVLCDSSGFSGGNVRVTDSIEQRSLTMVYMAHYCNDRRARFEFALSVLMYIDTCLNDLFFFLSNYDIQSEIISQHLDRVFIKRLVDCDHYSHLHH